MLAVQSWPWVQTASPAKLSTPWSHPPSPQTPQAAEFAAFVVGFRLLDAAATMYSDCKGVVDLVNSGFPKAIDAKRAYAGLVRDMLKWPKQRGYLGALVKVKAHQSISALRDQRERELAVGNSLADEGARLAVELHPPPPQEVADEVEHWLARAELVARTTARAMALFPPMGKRLVKVRRGSIRPPPPAAAPAGNGPAAAGAGSALTHEWKFTGGRWRCQTCAKLFVGEHLTTALQRQQCGGPRTQISAEAMASRGHDMAGAMASVPFAICMKCGAYAVRRVYPKLRGTCEGATAKGRQAIERLHRGLPPWDIVGRAALLGTAARLLGRWTHREGWVGVTTGPITYEDDPAQDGEDAAASHLADDVGDRAPVARADLHQPATDARRRLQELRARVRDREAANRAREVTQMDIKKARTMRPMSKRPRSGDEEDICGGDATRRRLACGGEVT